MNNNRENIGNQRKIRVKVKNAVAEGQIKSASQIQGADHKKQQQQQQ